MSETTPPDGQPAPVPTPEQLAQAADQLRNVPQPSVSPPPEDEVAAGLAARQSAAPAGITSVDAEKLMAAMAAMQARLDALEAEKRAGATVPLKSEAEVMRDLIRVHAAHNPGTDHAGVLRLADDAVDAAGNAADSGDGSIVHDLAGKLERALVKVHPGPGDHHYFAQALDFARFHLPEAAARVPRKPDREPAAAVSSDRAPATVIQGNVTG